MITSAPETILIAHLLALLATVTCVVGLPLHDEWQLYNQHKGQFLNESRGATELGETRFNAFRVNLEAINEFNNRSGETYKQGLNHFSDRTHSELLEKMMIRNASRISINEHIILRNTSWLRVLVDNFEAPPSVDYSKLQNRVGPVQDQGLCASGWAIATIGLIEGRQFRNSTSSELIQLSAQNLLDCDRYDLGCDGGDVEQALATIREAGGLNTEKFYPYKGKQNSSCGYSHQDAFVTTRYVRSIANLTSGDETMLKKTVARYGPVAVALDASQRSLLSYKSGVYFDNKCRSDHPNHHMLVVGYGTTDDGQDYWKLKNSWSSNWGMSGFMLLARNRNNHCGVATRATIVNIFN